MPRYRPVPVNWKDWILEDRKYIKKYLEMHSAVAPNIRLIDVVVPSYRIPEANLRLITGMQVPENWRTVFIIVLDNPKLASSIDGGWQGLESRLTNSSGHNVRVRENKKNMGASASRNAGIKESAAQWILFLDDDTEPDTHLLVNYEKHIRSCTDIDNVVGWLGHVQFPRQSMSLREGAVLMSYLTFAFEIATFDGVEHPAWGVTANLLVRRVRNLHLDTRYAKQGGGEDVDLCLRLSDYGRFVKAPKAVVYHPFWETSFYRHFFGWALGDGALFCRFKQYTYRSWPNVIETLFVVLPLRLYFSEFSRTALLVISFLCIDIIVDMMDITDFRHRVKVLGARWSLPYLLLGRIIGNSYVWVLELGRLIGHLRRKQLQNFARRFDWLCQKIPGAPEKFAKTELVKFMCFVATILVFQYCHL